MYYENGNEQQKITPEKISFDCTDNQKIMFSQLKGLLKEGVRLQNEVAGLDEKRAQAYEDLYIKFGKNILGLMHELQDMGLFGDQKEGDRQDKTMYLVVKMPELEDLDNEREISGLDSDVAKIMCDNNDVSFSKVGGTYLPNIHVVCSTWAEVDKDNHFSEAEVKLESHILKHWDKFVENALNSALNMINNRLNSLSHKRDIVSREVESMQEIIGSDRQDLEGDEKDLE